MTASVVRFQCPNNNVHSEARKEITFEKQYEIFIDQRVFLSECIGSSSHNFTFENKYVP